MKFFSTELTILNNPADDVEQRHDLDLMLALVINKLFSNQSLINQNLMILLIVYRILLPHHINILINQMMTRLIMNLN